MDLSRHEHSDVSRVTPIALADRMPSPPVLSSNVDSWKNLALQHYRTPPSRVELPGLRDHALIIHQAGPVMIEHSEYGASQKCWYSSGYINLLPAGQPVLRTIKGHTDVLCIHLGSELLAGVAQEAYDVDPGMVHLVPQVARPDETLSRFGRLLLTEVEAGVPATLLMAQSLGCALALHLLRCYSNLATVEPEKPPSLPGKRLQRVISYMWEHLDQGLTLADLSRASGLSQSQFVRAFREATGQPPHRYLLAIRVKKARELLEDTNQSVIEIGMQCGFERPNHFAASFGKSTGMSPRAWRIARRL